MLAHVLIFGLYDCMMLLYSLNFLRVKFFVDW